MNSALEVEALKARRAPVFRWAALVVIVGVPSLTAAFFALARMGGASTAAVKAAAMVDDLTAVGYLGLVGQVLSVALLTSLGIAASWSFGREFVDGAAPALFAIATPRGQVAAAKLAVLLAWAIGTVVLTMLVALGVGLGFGLQLSAPAWALVARGLVGGLLVAALTTPFALVASWRRGYLPGFVALLVSVVLTQIATVTGAGGWFPYAAPSLWLGMGGPEVAAQVTAVQLALPLVVGGLAAAATVRWWQRAEVF